MTGTSAPKMDSDASRLDIDAARQVIETEIAGLAEGLGKRIAHRGV